MQVCCSEFCPSNFCHAESFNFVFHHILEQYKMTCYQQRLKLFFWFHQLFRFNKTVTIEWALGIKKRIELCSVLFCSVQFRMVSTCLGKSICAAPRLSKASQCCLWNHFSVGLTDDGLFQSSQGRFPSAWRIRFMTIRWWELIDLWLSAGESWSIYDYPLVRAGRFMTIRWWELVDWWLSGGELIDLWLSGGESWSIYVYPVVRADRFMSIRWWELIDLCLSGGESWSIYD